MNQETREPLKNATKLIDGLNLDNFDPEMSPLLFDIKFLGTEARKVVINSAR